MDIKSAIEKTFAEYGVTAHWDLGMAQGLTVYNVDGIGDYELGVLMGVALAQAGLDDELLVETIAAVRSNDEIADFVLLALDSAEHNPKRRRPMPSIGEYVTVELNGGSRVHGEVVAHYDDGDGFELGAGYERLSVFLDDVKAWQS
jgi:hypothetical protein